MNETKYLKKLNNAEISDLLNYINQWIPYQESIKNEKFLTKLNWDKYSLINYNSFLGKEYKIKSDYDICIAKSNLTTFKWSETNEGRSCKDYESVNLIHFLTDFEVIKYKQELSILPKYDIEKNKDSEFCSELSARLYKWMLKKFGKSYKTDYIKFKHNQNIKCLKEIFSLTDSIQRKNKTLKKDFEEITSL